MLKACTLTGVDEKTSFDWIRSVSGSYPFAEFGILYSMTPDDKDDRYPSREFIDHFANAMEGSGVHTALHICGRAVAAFVAGDEDVRALAARFGRVQINFNASRSPFTVDDLARAIATVGHPVITQHFPSNAVVSTSIKAPNHHVLFDASGGNGRRGDGWPDRIGGKYMGYAGGFGPETIEVDTMGSELHANGEDYWIDMESRIRTDGWLDPEKCLSVLERVEPWTKVPAPKEASVLQYDTDGMLNGVLSFGS
jgi:hypothetical protein